MKFLILTRTRAERPPEVVWIFRFFWQIFNYPIASTQNDYTHEKDFCSICNLQITVKIYLPRETIYSSLAVLRILPINPNQVLVKISNDGENLLNRYVMLNRLLRILKDCQFVP